KPDLPGGGGPPSLPRGGREMTDAHQDLREDLRARFRAALRVSDGEACPPPADLWDVAAGTLPFDRSRQVVEHAARCAQCSESLRIARAVRAEVPAAPAAPVQLPGRLPVLAGLGLAAAVGAFLLFRPVPPDTAAVERGGTASPAEALRALSPDHQHPNAV